MKSSNPHLCRLRGNTWRFQNWPERGLELERAGGRLLRRLPAERDQLLLPSFCRPHRHSPPIYPLRLPRQFPSSTARRFRHSDVQIMLSVTWFGHGENMCRGYLLQHLEMCANVQFSTLLLKGLVLCIRFKLLQSVCRAGTHAKC